MQVAGAVVVVTGGGNGIGREVVLDLLSRGATIAAVDVNAAGLARTVELAAVAPRRLSTHVVDLTDLAAVQALKDDVVGAHGRVDALVNVAGIIQRFVPVAELSIEDIRRVMDVNFWGVVHTTTTFLPLLMARPTAAVVNVSSMGALVPVPGQSAYGASKAAVKLFTEGLYAELMGTSVAVTVVFPGGVGTNIAANSGVGIPGQERTAASAPTSMTSAPEAARQIVDGLVGGAYRVVIGKDARMVDRLSRLAPRRATELIAKKMKSLLG